MKTQTNLPLSKIRTDGGTQARVQMHEDTVQDYYEQMLAYVEFPKIVVFFDGATYWLADGFHRYFAHKRAGHDKVECDV